eukprot:339033_1
MSALFLVFAILFNIGRGHNHSIIFLVDESVQISEQNCRKQQNGISDYFQFFYDLKADNLLSYITFNQLGEINKIIDFNDEFHIPFDNLIHKIQSIDCSNNYAYKNITHDGVENSFSKINSALSSSILTYNQSDMKTPRILLFTRFQLKINPANVTTYISSIFDCKNILAHYNHYYFADFKIKIVNIDSISSDNNFISDYYSTCMPFSNIKVFSLKNVEDNTFLDNREEIIYAICGKGCTCDDCNPPPCKEDTAPPTVNPTQTPTISTNNPTISTNNPTISTNNPTISTNKILLYPQIIRLYPQIIRLYPQI